MKYKAFTLAEVLITLLIIGVVAALTIPSVISDYTQREFKTGLQKAVSVLNEAIQINIAQEGETPYENDDLYSYLKRHMNVISSGRDAYFRYYGKTSGFIGNREQRENYAWDYGPENYVFYTTDGMRFETTWMTGDMSKVKTPYLKLHESDVDILTRTNEWGTSKGSPARNCGSYGLASNPNKTINPPCVVLVDVNGNKKPNPKDASQITGYSDAYFQYTYPEPDDELIEDIFLILITEEKAIPYGVVAQRTMYSK